MIAPMMWTNRVARKGWRLRLPGGGYCSGKLNGEREVYHIVSRVFGFIVETHSRQAIPRVPKPAPNAITKRLRHAQSFCRARTHTCLLFGHVFGPKVDQAMHQSIVIQIYQVCIYHFRVVCFLCILVMMLLKKTDSFPASLGSRAVF